jgi:hypothetical protein
MGIRTLHEEVTRVAQDRTLLGTGRSGVEVVLDERTLLSQALRVRGHYETPAKEVLLRLGIRAYYEPFKMRTGDGEYLHVPDLMLPYKINERFVIMNFHPNDRKFYRKMAALREEFGNLFWFIHVRSSFADKSEDPFTRDGVHYTDERWSLRKIKAAETEPQDPIVAKRYAQSADGGIWVHVKDTERWKGQLGDRLVGLLAEVRRQGGETLPEAADSLLRAS